MHLTVQWMHLAVLTLYELELLSHHENQTGLA